jgi:cell division FtsZ-interacting protein ZapD
MFEIGDDERKVLLCLIHAETPLTVVEDTSLAVNVVIDIIRQLHHYRYIKAIGSNNQVMGNFDVDKIRITRFQLTAKGFNEISGDKKPFEG